ncbi:hypothetical protein [Alteromonas sp. KUL106]|uniref:hypothetical protein n=1 Tax=Alteromonas sp. KUL106 TaxID=2480799 RepID=UPI0012E5B16B|nr:hypothetical protein [Alteromonas sp. KUL106]GFD70364.1 hypothetical protein KUL106_36270 [Alteromonas sp. KUL106]
MDILSYNPDNSYWDLPSRVYGYVTEIEPEARSQSDSWWLTLECIDADMFDKVSIRNTSYPIPDSELTNISVTIAEFTFQPGEESFIKDGVCEGLWFEFRFSPLAIGKPFEHYWNLFSPPQIQFLKSVREVDSKLSNRLTESTQLNDISDASEEVIDGLLSNKIPDACAIYDVGQGNCNALLTKQDGEASPFVYFDLGGGVLGNTHTYPSKLRDFCFNKKPTIVLSHLDWDHWSSAQRCKEAKTMDWIVPRQQWGHVHKKFLLEINSHGTLNFWPDNLQKISKNGFEIVKCTGRGRNHSGLAMYAKNNSGDQKMLFTGDCSYNKIPDSNSRLQLQQNSRFQQSRHCFCGCPSSWGKNALTNGS